MGWHLIKHRSSNQPTVALSSGEAGLTGIVKGALNSQGFQALAAGMGLCLSITIFSDAAAAICVCSRRDLGNIKRLHAGDLLIHDRLEHCDFRVEKIDGASNRAEILTTHGECSILQNRLSVVALAWRWQAGPTCCPPELNSPGIRRGLVEPTSMHS